MIESENRVRGTVTEVTDKLATTHPDVARLTLEIVASMTMCGVNKMEFSEGVYNDIKDKQIEIFFDKEKDKLFIEIIKES